MILHFYSKVKLCLQIMLSNIVKIRTGKFVHHRNEDYVCTTFTLKQINHAVAEDFEIHPRLLKDTRQLGSSVRGNSRERLLLLQESERIQNRLITRLWYLFNLSVQILLPLLQAVEKEYWHFLTSSTTSVSKSLIMLTCFTPFECSMWMSVTHPHTHKELDFYLLEILHIAFSVLI